jgi:hypothetical protein
LSTAAPRQSDYAPRLSGVASANITGTGEHFFDTVYYPSLDHVSGRPYGLWVHGNNDTVGAAAAVGKLATGLALTQAADVLEVVGAVDATVRERAYELGGTLAATLME